jgi:hypothetical protein
MARLERAKDSSGDQLPPKQVSWRAQQARYVVSVDGQAKSSFEDKADAEAEAGKILARFPKLQVRVTDSQRDSVQMLGPTKAPEEPAGESTGE